jgi:hypothetical protein
MTEFTMVLGVAGPLEDISGNSEWEKVRIQEYVGNESS